MPYSSDNFESIKAKINRAEEHLSELNKINNKFRSVECSLSIETDSEKDLSYLSFNLPTPPKEVPTIAGDCINNLRSSLDYLIWQIVETNQIAEPSRSNMFPICETKEQFDGKIKGNRLRGVPQPAIDQIAKLQPFAVEYNHLLNLLNELCNKDKHRDLNYSISVASDVAMSFFKNDQKIYTMVVGNDEIKNGEVFGNIGFNPSLISGKDVNIVGKAQAYLAFRDLESEFGEALSVVGSLNEIAEYIKYEVIDSLISYLK